MLYSTSIIKPLICKGRWKDHLSIFFFSNSSPTHTHPRGYPGIISFLSPSFQLWASYLNSIFKSGHENAINLRQLFPSHTVPSAYIRHSICEHPGGTNIWYRTFTSALLPRLMYGGTRTPQSSLDVRVITVILSYTLLSPSHHPLPPSPWPVQHW